MRIVAIGAADPLGVHLALQERAVDIHFILDLTISVIESLAQ